MNRRQLILSVTTILFWSPSVLSQAPPPVRRPAYSPYLNLTRPGNVANNYYGLVRPQIDTNNSIYGLQNQVNALGQGTNYSSAPDTSLPTTGHATGYMNYSHYYALRGRSQLSNNVGGSSGAMAAAPTQNLSSASYGSGQSTGRSSSRVTSRH